MVITVMPDSQCSISQFSKAKKNKSYNCNNKKETNCKPQKGLTIIAMQTI